MTISKVRTGAHTRRAQEAGTRGAFGQRHIDGRWLRQGGRCHYCRERLSLSGPDKFQVDHFIPLSRGGSNWPSNIVLACPGCNLAKGSKLPSEFRPAMFREGGGRDG